MNVKKWLTRFLWQSEEKRLRAVWRLGIHTLLVLILTAIFTVILLFGVVVLDIATGASIQDVITGSGPIQWVEASWVNLVIAPLASFAGILSATFMAGRWIDRRKFSDFGISFSKVWWIDFAFGLGLGAGLMGLIFLIGWLTGSLQVTGYFVVFQQEGGFVAGFFQALVLFVCVGIYEELLSRGYHLINLAEGFNHSLIGKRTALLMAYGLSSLVFGVLHLGNPNATWVSVVNISLAGLFLGLGMVLTGSLAIPIGLHITWNLFQGNVFGFAVSGIRVGATLIATESVANSWLMGSAFGPESGVVGILAMLLGGVLTVLWVRRNQSLRLRTDLATYVPLVNPKGQHPQSGDISLNTD